MLAEHLSTTGASGPELLRAVWDWAGHADRAPFMRLFFEVYIDAMAHPDARSERAQAMVTEWLDQFGAALGSSPADAADSAAATLVIAVLRGLLLDRLNTGDEERTDRALERFAQFLAGQGQPDPAERVRRPPDPGQTGTHQGR